MGREDSLNNCHLPPKFTLAKKRNNPNGCLISSSSSSSSAASFHEYIMNILRRIGCS